MYYLIISCAYAGVSLFFSIPKVEFIITFVSVSLCLVVVLVWPNDPRLNGEYQSSSQETIRYLKNKTNIEYNWEFIEKLYDHSSLEFQGHKITNTIKEFSYSRASGEKKITAGFSITQYFVDIKNRNNKMYLVTIPTNFWRISEIEISEIEFEGTGFWLNTHDSMSSGFSKEKYIRE